MTSRRQLASATMLSFLIALVSRWFGVCRRQCDTDVCRARTVDRRHRPGLWGGGERRSRGRAGHPGRAQGRRRAGVRHCRAHVHVTEYLSRVPDPDRAELRQVPRPVWRRPRNRARPGEHLRLHAEMGRPRVYRDQLTPVVLYQGVSQSSLEDMNIDCQSVSGIIGTQYDSENTPPSDFNGFHDIVWRACHIGFRRRRIRGMASPRRYPAQTTPIKPDASRPTSSGSITSSSMGSRGQDASGRGSDRRRRPHQLIQWRTELRHCARQRPTRAYRGAHSEHQWRADDQRVHRRQHRRRFVDRRTLPIRSPGRHHPEPDQQRERGQMGVAVLTRLQSVRDAGHSRVGRQSMEQSRYDRRLRECRLHRQRNRRRPEDRGGSLRTSSPSTMHGPPRRRRTTTIGAGIDTQQSSSRRTKP